MKKHKNSKLSTSGLVTSKQLPFIRVSSDSVFTCSCCPESLFPVEYKCPYKIRDKSFSDSWKDLDFFYESDGNILLAKDHKYYSQVTAQISLKDAKAGYFVVWTPVGEPFIQKIPLDQEHRRELERNAIICFPIHM